MSLIRRPKKNRRKKKGGHTLDIKADIAIARYEYGIPAPRRPITYDEAKPEASDSDETAQNA